MHILVHNYKQMSMYILEYTTETELKENKQTKKKMTESQITSPQKQIHEKPRESDSHLLKLIRIH